MKNMVVAVEFVAGTSKGALCDACTTSHNPNWTLARVTFSDEPEPIVYCPACYGRLRGEA